MNDLMAKLARLPVLRLAVLRDRCGGRFMARVAVQPRRETAAETIARQRMEEPWTFEQ